MSLPRRSLVFLFFRLFCFEYDDDAEIASSGRGTVALFGSIISDW